MATLKGQNLRVLASQLNSSGWSVIGMATNCTITLTNNTDQSITKDDVGLASKPEVISKTWSVQVESLDVVNVAVILAKMKSFEKIHLMWDEVSSSNNQTPIDSGVAAFSRIGEAYLSDATLSFNNRENSVKNMQFIGASNLESIPSSGMHYDQLDAGSYTKGQYVRLFLGNNNTDTPNKVIAFAQQLQIHVSLEMDDATTKDTTGNWQVQEPTALSYEITTNALVRSGENITSSIQGQTLEELETIFEEGLPVKFKVANVNGANNRTAVATILSGSVIVTSLTINAQNRQSASYDATLQGYGEYML